MDKVYCYSCKYYWECEGELMEHEKEMTEFIHCTHLNATTETDTWHARVIKKIHPMIRNKNNDCSDYRRKS